MEEAASIPCGSDRGKRSSKGGSSRGIKRYSFKQARAG
jgi:hypothetical protein